MNSLSLVWQKIDHIISSIPLLQPYYHKGSQPVFMLSKFSCTTQINTYNPRFEGWLNFPLFQKNPVNFFEEWMLFNGIFTVLRCHTAQTFVWVFCHKLHGKQITNFSYIVEKLYKVARFSKTNSGKSRNILQNILFALVFLMPFLTQQSFELSVIILW